MRRFAAAVLLICSLPLFAETPKKPATHAKNVIVFLADAGGIPVLYGASILGYNAPQKLYVQSWQNLGLSDTSPYGNWVTDSAAGMSAIVTGVKTRNGFLSETPDGIRGQKEGTPTKTILEYAEERGLSTGVVTNMEVADATPAACYSHVNDRARWGDIYLQIFSPRFGDGVDIAFGAGRKQIYDQVTAQGKDLDAIAKEHGRTIYSSVDQVPADAQRALVISDSEPSVPEEAKRAIQALSKNPKGYFLMVEWDAHTSNPEKGLNHIIAFDKLIREISSIVDMKDTLLIFTADHSFDFRLDGGSPDQSILTGWKEWQEQNAGTKNKVINLPAIRVNDSHAGEEVLATGMGPGSQEIHGFFPNTHLFQVMMDAYGWKPDAAK
jgi:alkaline phosphatase